MLTAEEARRPQLGATEHNSASLQAWQADRLEFTSRLLGAAILLLTIGTVLFLAPLNAYGPLLMLCFGLQLLFLPKLFGLQPGRAPLFVAVGAVYMIYFAVPALVAAPMRAMGRFVSEQAADEAAFLALLAWLVISFGYAVGLQLKKSSARQPPSKSMSLRAAVILVSVGLPVTLARAAFTIPLELAQLTNLFGGLLLAGLGILFVLSLRKMLPSWATLLTYVSIVCYMAPLLLTGLVASAAVPLAFFFTLFWMVKGRVPIVAIALSAGVFFLIKPTLADYRTATWTDRGATMSSVQKTQLLADLFEKKFSGNGYVSGAGDVARDRTNQLATFGRVIQLTPSSVPYWDGYSYSSIFYSLIPRALWPDKPKKDLGQQFGHRYRILDESDTLTSVNFPFLAETYANFGSFGILLTFIAGLCYAWLSGLYEVHSEGDVLSMSFGCFIMSKMLNVESDFSLTFGLAIQTVIIFTLVDRWFKLRRSRTRETAGSAPFLPGYAPGGTNGDAQARLS